ncbi:MAG TPA: helix-turn-helix domain-containing protein [Candidatus Thermoplasmatota archaeon]|nr:helix-turn-helix domain-containing protein [Candidatus Thermoplasmatota archaeon]
MALPPSAVAVLSLLASRGPLTHKALVESAPIPPRTVRYALARLKQEGRVLERPSFRDSRQSYYLLATGDVAAEASVLLGADAPARAPAAAQEARLALA